MDDEVSLPAIPGRGTRDRRGVVMRRWEDERER